MNDLTIYRKQAGDLDGEHTQVSTALRELDAFEVRSNEDSEFAADLIRDVKAKHKELDERRKEVTQPLNTTVRTINSWFKPALDALEQAERKLKAKVALYVQDCERKAREAIALAAAAETEEEASKALAEAPAIAAMPQGVSMRMAWKWKIVDESKIPAYLCSPDMNKIAAEIRGSLQDVGAPSEIPGVEFWQEPVMTVRK